ncbi:protease modulator HflC [Spirochaeta isovalerica]|uniref:Protein HflC n=1 Tax=Spirochaeta isovalerica TaxID=150 RepID=A0A841RCH7_9SPIO|nr:protease modulator HflC [Spirochaeta isovalerica]MBB6481653.1 membrane protease subunit HflC [Spirochaeta isovalerica]
MNKMLKTLIPLLILVVIFFAAGPLYIVNEGEQAVITRLGRIDRVVTEAGLKIKWPLIESRTRYSKKILSWDGAPQKIQTAENQYIWVDTTARWKISDATEFYKSINNMSQAYSKLDDVIDSAVRTIIARNSLSEAVRNSDIIIELQAKSQAKTAEDKAVQEASGEVLTDVLLELPESNTDFEKINMGRRQLSQQMLSNAAKDTNNLGIELIDVVIRQIRYSDEMTQSVYDRMIKDRNQIAQFYRSYGEGKKLDLMGQLDNEKEVILSQAYAEAEGIKGEADALAARIYNDSYGQDPEFYEFWKAMESYRKTLPGMSKTLSTDMQYFNNFYRSDN